MTSSFPAAIGRRADSYHPGADRARHFPYGVSLRLLSANLPDFKDKSGS
jgi:hypothetical protein